MDYNVDKFRDVIFTISSSDLTLVYYYNHRLALRFDVLINRAFDVYYLAMN